MRCDEARRRLSLGPDREAEDHLASCLTCFEALEAADVLVVALRGARPEAVAVPTWLTSRVISRWQLRRRGPWFAGAALLGAASVAAAVVLWLLAGALAEPAWILETTLGSLLQPLAGGLLGLGDDLRSKFVENPAWLTALVMVAAIGGAGAFALYRLAEPAPRQAVT